MSDMGPKLQRLGVGTKLDIFAFLMNLGLMPLLHDRFKRMVQDVAAGDPAANNLLFAMFVLMFTLAPIGAILKRWHDHKDRRIDPAAATSSCLFNPIMYLVVVLLIMSVLLSFIFEKVYGPNLPEDGGGVFIGSICVGMVLAVVHTWYVYSYFEPPSHEPRSQFLRSPLSDKLGSAAFWANMLVFQLFWNLLVSFGLPRVHGLGELVLRTGLVFFMALLIYFPPRMFSMLTDGHRKFAWLTIIGANLPAILRLVIGVPYG